MRIRRPNKNKNKNKNKADFGTESSAPLSDLVPQPPNWDKSPAHTPFIGRYLTQADCAVRGSQVDPNRTRSGPEVDPLAGRGGASEVDLK